MFISIIMLIRNKTSNAYIAAISIIDQLRMLYQISQSIIVCKLRGYYVYASFCGRLSCLDLRTSAAPKSTK